MKATTKKISKNEWILTVSEEKPIFNTRIFKEKGFYCNDHNMREFKTLAEMKNYFVENQNDFI